VIWRNDSPSPAARFVQGLGDAVRLRPAAAPYVAAAAALALETATHLLDYGAYDLRVRLLDSSAEWSYSHLLGTLAFAIGAVCGGVGAAAASRRRVAWWAICCLFAFLLVDNLTRFHEHVPAWPAIYAPALCALTAAIAIVAADTDLAPFVYAGIALLFGSLAIHVFGPGAVRAFGWSADSWAYQVKVALKEGTELAGWVLLVPALGRLARRQLRPARRAWAGVPA
jgi:hypothetical protein